jgi:hypothetical protein
MKIRRFVPSTTRFLRAHAAAARPQQTRFAPRALTLVVLPAALAIGLSGCGGSSEPAKGPEPTKVVWSRGEGDDAAAPANAPAASSGEDTQIGPKEIDLDALPPKGAAKEARAAAKEPPPEPPKAEPPPPPAPEPSAAAEDGEPAAEEPEPPPAAPMPLGKEMRAAVKSDDKAPPPKKAPKQKAEPAPAPETAAISYNGPNPCKTTHFSVERVEQACANNGRSGAKTVMKEAIGKALAAGASLKCADCHADTTSYSLKKDAVAQLRKWLGP